VADGTTNPPWAEGYLAQTPVFARLAAEVEFALETITGQEGIKTHSITSRVKELQSLIEKCREKEIDDPLSEVVDLVGIRVVVLFLSDLPRLDEVIRKTFEVHEAEDKVLGGDPASFGYMSIHYVGTLKDEHAGPRYDDLKKIRFEIQARTIGMDAWANVSHYLDYKGESSVPEELKKDFYALSGLFYVADQHFEIFASRARESREQAEERLQSDAASDLEINLDTMEAFLARRYPDRVHGDRASVSRLVEEVASAGITTLGALDLILDEVETRFLKAEVEYPPTVPDEQPGPEEPPRRYMDVGAVRGSLRIHGDLPALINFHPGYQ
jgi:ppGpp synthetase/RelA/SpoT-type nucleotidyltranferase